MESVAGDYTWNGHNATRAVLQGEIFNPGDKMPGVPDRHVRFIDPAVRFAYANEVGYVALDLAGYLEYGFAYIDISWQSICGPFAGVTFDGTEFHIWKGCSP